MKPPQRDFRWREDVGFERRCPHCAEWWPITLEFWDKKWTKRCRGCILEWKRINQNNRYKTEPKYADDRREAARLTAWKDRQNKPEELHARRKVYRAANMDRIRTLARLHYAANREHILEQQRQRRANAKRAA